MFICLNAEEVHGQIKFGNPELTALLGIWMKHRD